MSHHLPSTHLDHVSSGALIAFTLFVLIMIAGPARLLARERDVARTEHVRQLMEAAVQLEVTQPTEYESLIAQISGADGTKMMLGMDDCSGSYGRMCSDLAVDDECLNIHNYFDESFLPEFPVDPQQRQYSEDLSGYYFSLYQGRLEVGSCQAALAPILLRR